MEKFYQDSETLNTAPNTFFTLQEEIKADECTTRIDKVQQFELTKPTQEMCTLPMATNTFSHSCRLQS